MMMLGKPSCDRDTPLSLSAALQQFVEILYDDLLLTLAMGLKLLFYKIFSSSVLLMASLLGATAAADGLPKSLTWSAYNLGTTGYNQSVAIGKMLREHYGTTLRVIPGKNDISRLLPLVKGRVQFSANGIATYFAQEGVQQFAATNWGPLPLRIVLTSNGDSNQAIGVAADTGIKTLGELRGKRVPYVRGAPAINETIRALLACADLTWADVERVEFPGYSAMWNGVINGQIDAAYATTVSGPARKLEASPRGIHWPPVPHKDAGCWQRMAKVVPFFSQHHATRGAGISPEQPHEGATYPYPILVTLADTDSEMVFELTRALHLHYDDYKEADPGSIGWALDRQLFNWVVPFHDGAVQYLRKAGVWTDALDAHNNALIARQDVLQQAWQNYQAGPGKTAQNKAAFSAGWLAARIEALEQQGMDPIWR